MSYEAGSIRLAPAESFGPDHTSSRHLEHHLRAEPRTDVSLSMEELPMLIAHLSRHGVEKSRHAWDVELDIEEVVFVTK